MAGNKTERTEAQKSTENSKKKNKTLTLKINRNLFYVTVAIFLVVVVLFVGKAWGVSSQKKKDSRLSPFGNSQSAKLPVTNRWTSVGTVTAVSDSKISVKDARGETKDAIINKDTRIVNRKGENVKITDVKKDARIIVNGTRDEKDKNKLTATRIRLEQ